MQRGSGRAEDDGFFALSWLPLVTALVVAIASVLVWRALAAQSTGAVPHFVLAAGLALAVLLGITLHTIQVAASRANTLARSNEELHKEIAARSQAQAALRESGAFLDSVLDNIPIMVWVKDAKTLKYLRFNRGAEALVGTTKDEVIGKNDAELFPMEAQLYAAKDREVLESRGLIEIPQEVLRTSDGGIRTVRTKKLPVCDDQGVPLYVIGIAEDITESTRIHRDLQESEERLRLIADNIPLLISYLDKDEKFRFANRRYGEWWGLDPASLYGKSLREFYGEEAYKSIAPRIALALCGQTITYEREMSTLQGVRAVEVTAVPRRDASAAVIGLYIAITDITERKQAALAVERSRRFLDAVIEGVPQPLFVKDALHRWTLLNERFCKMLGHDRAELLGKSDPDFFPPEAAKRYWSEDDEALGMDLPLYVENLFSRFDGSTRWQLVSKQRVQLDDGTYVVGVSTDITNLKRTQAALAQSEASHRLLAENSSDLIVRITPSGALTYVSPASFTVLGYRPDELLGRFVPEFIHTDDRERAMSSYAEVVKANAQRVVTCRLLAKDGRWIWSETSFRAERDPRGARTMYVIGVCRNVDERVRVSEALQAANENLEQYYAYEQEEKRVAKHVLDQLVRVNPALADRVDSWTLPARYFSGDVVAVTETPGRVLHVLLADGTGHGLSAALGALPAVQPFYAMSQKGFSIATIVREMNAKVHELLPTGRFIAATLASINPNSGVIQVWNGGNPPCYLFDDEGSLITRFTSTHLALGVVGDAEFDAQIETIKLERKAQLILISDGLIDAQNAEHQAFGEQTLLKWCGFAPPGTRLRSLRSAVHGHLGYQPPDDDISIVVARCELAAGASDQIASVSAIAPIAKIGLEYRVQLTLGADQLKSAEIVPALCTLLRELQLVKPNDSPAFVVLNELFSNALDHGLLQLDTQRETQQTNLEPYLSQRSQRLAQLQTGSIDILAERVTVDDRAALRLVVRDTGPGFDFNSVLESPPDAAHPRQGGIAILRDLCMTLTYRDDGREVEALVRLSA